MSVPAKESWLSVHPLSAHDRPIMAAWRAMVEPGKGKLRGIAARAPFDAVMGNVALPQDVSFRADQIGGVPGWWCEPSQARSNAAILHLHGGWFNLGSAMAYRHLVGHIARSAGVPAFVPDYRLAPEHPFPAAIEDAKTTLLGLERRGIDRISVTGDSAGGGLALSLLALVGAESAGVLRPLAGLVLSPITDLALSGASWESRAEADPLFVREQAQELIQAYLQGHDPTDGRASPLYGSLVGLPPIRVQVGEDEVLLDDAVRFGARAVAAGVDARVDVWQGMPHGFSGTIGRTQAAADALRAGGEFLASRLAS
jgi:monoterpene epsilon-lactone hydrolase